MILWLINHFQEEALWGCFMEEPELLMIKSSPGILTTSGSPPGQTAPRSFLREGLNRPGSRPDPCRRLAIPH